MSPFYVPGAYLIAGSGFKDVERIVDALGSGRAFGWHEHDRDLFIGTEKLFRPGYAANLVDHWIPALDGVEDKLRTGAKVADIGCGLGASTILMAEAYPQSTFVGFDYHDASIALARTAAASAGVTDRCASKSRPPTTSRVTATTSSPRSTASTTSATLRVPHATCVRRWRRAEHG